LALPTRGRTRVARPHASVEYALAPLLARGLGVGIGLGLLLLLLPFRKLLGCVHWRDRDVFDLALPHPVRRPRLLLLLLVRLALAHTQNPMSRSEDSGVGIFSTRCAQSAGFFGCSHAKKSRHMSWLMFSPWNVTERPSTLTVSFSTATAFCDHVCS